MNFESLLNQQALVFNWGYFTVVGFCNALGLRAKRIQEFQ